MRFQCLPVKFSRGIKQWVQRRIGRLPRFMRAAAFFARDFHASGFGQFFNSLDEVQIVVVHHEAEGVTASAAAKAIVELLVRADTEGGGFLFVKRAAGGVILAGFFHLQARAHHIDDVGAVQKVVNEALGN